MSLFPSRFQCLLGALSKRSVCRSYGFSCCVCEKAVSYIRVIRSLCSAVSLSYRQLDNLLEVPSASELCFFELLLLCSAVRQTGYMSNWQIKVNKVYNFDQKQDRSNIYNFTLKRGHKYKFTIRISVASFTQFFFFLKETRRVVQMSHCYLLALYKHFQISFKHKHGSGTNMCTLAQNQLSDYAFASYKF